MQIFSTFYFVKYLKSVHFYRLIIFLRIPEAYFYLPPFFYRTKSLSKKFIVFFKAAIFKNKMAWKDFSKELAEAHSIENKLADQFRTNAN
jgi:hypothetical protein